jgi:hypothetical protein
MSAVPDARGGCSETSNNRPPSARTQRERILKLLVDACGGWVPLPVIAAQVSQYNARVFELRRSGHVIENRTKDVEGVRRSWFRLAAPPKPMVSAAGAGGSVPETLPLFGNEVR